MDGEKLFRNLKSLNWGILLLLALLSYFLMEQAFTLGIIVGGLMIIANFNILKHTIQQGFSPDGTMQPKKTSIIVKSYLRLAAMGALIYLFITRQWVHPVGLAIGLSIVVISIVSIGIHMLWKTSSEETT
ncbi:MAG: ATP synthase subunit I [Desulfobacterales bacterium]|nr:ATP synthase subunit I [Desulfobacterales bacterium]